MKLDALSPAHVRRAIQIYLERAWEGGAPASGLDLAPIERAQSIGQVLEEFDEEREGTECRRWTLRLGNTRYPFMKLVVEAYLVPEEFAFSVDTHDNLDVRPNAPDYGRWEELKRYNRQLKDRIESEWTATGLPTHADVKRMLQGLATVEQGGGARARIVLADDDRPIAEGLQAWLGARGFQVELCHDGTQVLARLARAPRPDLVILDYEMPGLDGEAVLDRIRRDLRYAQLPVLLATAADIDLERVQRASALLQKPYSRQVLLAMVERLLRDRAPVAGPPAGEP